MPSFDYIADDLVKPDANDWMEQAALLRKFAENKGMLTDKRVEFIHKKAISKLDRNEQGEHKVLDVPFKAGTFGFNAASFSKSEVLEAYPQYSARLLLHFKLISPLLSRDDDPFYLIDNPTRKDHIFKSPYLSAASVKGLSFDAYQRAFTASESGGSYRQQDEYAQRLFGLADDGVEYQDEQNDSQRGRLRFSPIWFRQLQFLVINSRDPNSGQGGVPIQFEAVAANQNACLELVYFNPFGIENSSEQTVRDDLARWLASVASWWPVLGIGGKRLAGYGQIQIESVEIQAVNWSGMEANKENKPIKKIQAKVVIEPPANYDLFLNEQAKLISEEQLQGKIVEESQLLEAEIAELDDKRRHTKGKAQSKAMKAWEKAQKKQASQAQQLKNSYQKALKYWQVQGKKEGIVNNQTELMNLPEYPIYEKKLSGKDSWIKMAQWMAGEVHE